MSLKFTSLKLFVRLLKNKKISATGFPVHQTKTKKVKSFHTSTPQKEGIAILHNAILAQSSKETFDVILKRTL